MFSSPVGELGWGVPSRLGGVDRPSARWPWRCDHPSFAACLNRETTDLQYIRICGPVDISLGPYHFNKQLLRSLHVPPSSQDTCVQTPPPTFLVTKALFASSSHKSQQQSAQFNKDPPQDNTSAFRPFTSNSRPANPPLHHFQISIVTSACTSSLNGRYT